VEAYQLCLKARYHWFKWTDEGFRKATQLFEQALALDPEYALAIFGLADSYIASAVVGLERDPSTCESMLERATRSDPELAEAHAILGLVQGMWTWRWPRWPSSVLRRPCDSARGRLTCWGRTRCTCRCWANSTKPSRWDNAAWSSTP